MCQSEDRFRCTPTKCRQYLRIFLANLFSHVGLCGLVVGYALVGAITFEALEAKHEMKQRNQIKLYRSRCLQDLWQITLDLNVFHKENYSIIVGQRLREFEKDVVTAVKNEGYDGKDAGDHELQWSFSGALLYSVTVITTIGYGNIAPKTTIGKMVTILYALLGVPLMLLCLTNIGDLFAHAFKFAYSKVCCVLCRDNRKYRPQRSSVHCDGAVKYVAHTHVQVARASLSSVTTTQPPSSKPPITAIDIINEGSETESTASTTKLPMGNRSPQRLLTSSASQRLLQPPSPSNNAKNGSDCDSDHIQEAETVNIERVPQMESAEARVPIYLVMSFVCGYICLGAMIFSLWEDWTFLNGAYFCFITLSTIGFGDLVPGTSILDTKSETGQAKLIICCFYLILGLAIIAMSFNLVQEEVTAKCKQIGRNLGILDDEDSDD